VETSAQKRILIVDDEELIREICVRTLAPLGHRVETAENAEQAIVCFERDAFDLMITDYRMPGALDGLALGKEIKRRFPQTQLILMTGFPTLENAVAALQAGAMDYLVKPFDRAELIDYVNRRHMTLGEISPPSKAVSLFELSKAAVSIPSSQRPMPKILLVDDSRTILALFKNLLEKSGYTVLTAKDGETGLATALEQKPALVILDGELPKFDGFEVCRRLRLDAQMKSTKILMFTAGTEGKESKRAQDAGADGFLSKNAKPGDTLKAVRQLLHNEGQEGVC
jgi:DNA-binding response OmpR family regulator